MTDREAREYAIEWHYSHDRSGLLVTPTIVDDCFEVAITTQYEGRNLCVRGDYGYALAQMGRKLHRLTHPEEGRLGNVLSIGELSQRLSEFGEWFKQQADNLCKVSLREEMK